MANFFFDRLVQDMPDELEKMNEISTHEVRLQTLLCLLLVADM
jgi:hypothetical protein